MNWLFLLTVVIYFGSTVTWLLQGKPWPALAAFGWGLGNLAFAISTRNS